MSWLFVPGLEDLSSGSASLSDISERLAAWSVQWRGKPQPPQAWSRRWKQGGFIHLLSGLTCSPSTLDRGVASFISSLRETPARTTALPESVPEPMASASLLPRSAGSPTSAGLILSSARTCRGTRPDNSRPSSRHWSDWATALRQEYSVRARPATPCDASDCSSWPSPMAGLPATESYNEAGNSDFSRKAMKLAEEMLKHEWIAPVADDTGTRSKRYEQGGMPLSMQADQWEAPSVAVTDGTRMARGGARSDELLLTGQAVRASDKWASPKASDPEKAGPNMRGSKGDVPLPGQAANWPGPATRDHKGSSEGSIIRQDGKSRADMLDYAAEQFFHPPSSQVQPIVGGSMSSTAGPNSNQPSAKRKLNPIFVEALMRWPTGLSGFERQETAWTRWWQLQLSYLSALVSQPSEPAQQELF